MGGDVRLVPLVVVFDRVCWLAVVGCDGWLPWLVISSTRLPRRIDWLVLSVVVCYISVYHLWCIRSLVRVSCTCGEYSWRVFCPRARPWDQQQTQSKTLQCLTDIYWSSSSSTTLLLLLLLYISFLTWCTIIADGCICDNVRAWGTVKQCCLQRVSCIHGRV